MVTRCTERWTNKINSIYFASFTVHEFDGKTFKPFCVCLFLTVLKVVELLDNFPKIDLLVRCSPKTWLWHEITFYFILFTSSGSYLITVQCSSSKCLQLILIVQHSLSFCLTPRLFVSIQNSLHNSFIFSVFFFSLGICQSLI